jgi:hypothetical protein
MGKKPAHLAAVPKFEEQAEKMRTDFLKEMRDAYRWQKQCLGERIEQLRLNREAMPLLQELGFEIETQDYGTDLLWLYIDLGSACKGGLKGKAAVEGQKAMIAKALKCHLEEQGMEVSDGKKGLARVTLKPAKYPGIRISYIDKLPTNGQCKIVERVSEGRRKSKYYDIVCDAR